MDFSKSFEIIDVYKSREVDESDYVSSFIKKETFEEIAVHYVQSSNDIDEITKLEHLIEKKKKELTGK